LIELTDIRNALKLLCKGFAMVLQMFCKAFAKKTAMVLQRASEYFIYALLIEIT
jgi:hypothetical protein